MGSRSLQVIPSQAVLRHVELPAWQFREVEPEFELLTEQPQPEHPATEVYFSLSVSVFQSWLPFSASA